MLWLTIARHATRSVSSILLGSLAPNVVNLPVIMRPRVIRLFSTRLRPIRGLDCLTHAESTDSRNAKPPAARVHHRTIQRWLAQAGFSAPRDLIRAARVAQAWSMIETQTPLPLIASRVGFESVRSLCESCRSLIGVGPRVAAKRMDGHDVAMLLENSVTRPFPLRSP